MHKLIVWLEHLKRIAAFEVSTRVVIITLMVLGIWVATKDLQFPPGLQLNDKLIHMVVFFAFGFLMDMASSRKPFWLWKGLPLLAYGAGIEVLQYFTPFRSFSVLDLVADFSGIFTYFLIKSLVIYLDNNHRSDN